MVEDAKCNSPCGMEPMGCADCNPYFSPQRSFDHDDDLLGMDEYEEEIT